MRKQWEEEKKIRDRINQEMKLKKQQQVARQAAGLYRNPYPMVKQAHILNESKYPFYLA